MNLVILDFDGNYIDHIDLPNLGNAQKNYIRSILEEYFDDSLIGDINDDSVVNVQDIILLVNMILSNQIDFIADLNEDSNVDILDVILLINMILN